MTARDNENVSPGRYNNNRPGQSRPPVPGPGRGRARRTGTVRIAGHETRVMTPEQYDNATEALAVLIGQWLQHHPDPCPACAAHADERDGDGQLTTAA